MKTLIILLTALTLVLPSVSFAAPRCPSKKNHTVKYDNKKKKCVYTKKSKWKISTSRDGITRSVEVFATLEANNKLYSGNIFLPSILVIWKQYTKSLEYIAPYNQTNL